MAHELDAPVIESGGKGDYRFEKQYKWEPCPVDRRLKDGDTITLGGVTIKAIQTPGHTRGNMTYTLTVDGKRVVIAGSVSINPGVRLKSPPSYPGIAEDYARSIQTLRALPCDIFLSGHPWVYSMEEKHRRGDFVDPAGYHQFLDAMESAYRKKLAE